MTKTSRKEPTEKAYVLIKYKTGLESSVLEHVGRIPGLQKIEYTAGTGCMLLGIVACTLEGLRETIDLKLQKISQIYSTTTIFCGQTPLEGGEIYE